MDRRTAARRESFRYVTYRNRAHRITLRLDRRSGRASTQRNSRERQKERRIGQDGTTFATYMKGASVWDVGKNRRRHRHRNVLLVEGRSTEGRYVEQYFYLPERPVARGVLAAYRRQTLKSRHWQERTCNVRTISGRRCRDLVRIRLRRNNFGDLDPGNLKLDDLKPGGCGRTKRIDEFTPVFAALFVGELES